MNNSSLVISARKVCKCYTLYDHPRTRLLHALNPRYRRGMQAVWALRDVDFEVLRGEAVGIIGRNGSGKSTLLEIIAGTLKPTSGGVKVHGRIAALLELSSGFNPEFTGQENVFLNGMLLGLSRKEIEEKYDDIIGFADIGDVLNRPVKTYSSGMLIRLAFSVQIALNPEILIVDEALSVGDFFFQQKCFSRLRQMQEDGLTLLFVSHNTEVVNNLCSKAVYLQQGYMKFFGDKQTAIRKYLSECSPHKVKDKASEVSSLSSTSLSDIPDLVSWRRPAGPLPQGGGLVAVSLLDQQDQLITSVPLGHSFRLRVYFVPDPTKTSHIYITFRDRYDHVVFTSGTYYLNIDLSNLINGDLAIVEFEMRAMFSGGRYSISVVLGFPAPPNRLGEIIDQIGGIGPLNIQFDYLKDRAPFLGPFGLPITARINGIKTVYDDCDGSVTREK